MQWAGKKSPTALNVNRYTNQNLVTSVLTVKTKWRIFHQCLDKHYHLTHIWVINQKHYWFIKWLVTYSIALNDTMSTNYWLGPEIRVKLHHLELEYMQLKTAAILSLSQCKEWIWLLVYSAAATGIHIINIKKQGPFFKCIYVSKVPTAFYLVDLYRSQNIGTSDSIQTEWNARKKWLEINQK